MFTDCVVLAQIHNPSTIIVLGDFNVGNIFLDDKIFREPQWTNAL